MGFLSKKYKVLLIFKGCLVLFGILVVIGYMYFLFQLNNNFPHNKVSIMKFVYTVSTIFILFCNYCSISVINFLFDLDKDKLNK